MDQLEGTVTGTVFRNPENGYSVVQIQSGRREYTVVGILPELAPGEQGIFAGQMVEHPQYGSQLKCTQFQLQIPSTLLGMERFLGSGLIAGIGRATAKRIVEHFKLDTMEVFSEHPERLSEIRGLGKKRLQALHVHDTDGYRDLHTLPFTSGNDFRLIMRLLREIGYEGDLTFEADSFYAGFPDEMLPDVAEFMQKTGRQLIRMMKSE